MPDNVKNFKLEIAQIMSKIYLTSELKITTDERKDNISSFKLNDNFSKKEFQELWNKIKVKTVYEVNFDSSELIEKAVKSINLNLKIKKSKAIITSEA